MTTPVTHPPRPATESLAGSRSIVLISTYDLGRQPFGLASPARWLRDRGLAVRCLDVAREPLDEDAIAQADAIAFHLPMHTATRLAGRMVARVRALAPRARLAAYGLYAAMNASYLRGLGVERAIGGEFEAELVRWAMGEDAPDTTTLERLAFRVPDRAGLPTLAGYAHLHDADGTKRIAGYTEASRGCKHRCRHCPIVPVYDGRFRVVPIDVVLADVRQQVEAGARHVTFGDPDFWNGIGHAIPLVHALHAEHPDLTYDVTIKVEHLLRHREHLATLSATGCQLVTSAVESVDDDVLARLDKGHTRADVVAAVQACAAAGLALQPTFIAFMPWTTVAGYQRLLATIAELDLIDHVAPIQLTLRLLVTAGSRLLELDDVRSLVGPFDDEALVHPWRHDDPEVDALQARLQADVHRLAAAGADRGAVFAHCWEQAERTPGAERLPVPASARAPRARKRVPFLTEPWYC